MWTTNAEKWINSPVLTEYYEQWAHTQIPTDDGSGSIRSQFHHHAYEQLLRTKMLRVEIHKTSYTNS